MLKRLSGKACTITGAGGSIGREPALMFARERGSVVGCGLQLDNRHATLDAVLAAGALVDLAVLSRTRRLWAVPSR